MNGVAHTIFCSLPSPMTRLQGQAGGMLANKHNTDEIGSILRLGSGQAFEIEPI